MQTQTTYIEPEGFKGTPGEFYRNNTYVMIFGTGKDVAICATKTMDAKLESSGYHPSVLQEIRMNAQLFAASKDLLRELQNAASLLEQARTIFITKIEYPNAHKLLNTALININDAINKALGNLSNITDNG